MKRPNLLALLLKEFFVNYLSGIRGMSQYTIHSYRDGLVLLLRFIASHTQRPASLLDLEDLGPHEVQSFLNHLERERKNRGSTRNVRLSAIHAFFRFVAAKHPDRLEHAQRILGIPFKKTVSRVIDYLEYDELQEVLSAIDQTTPKGRRDHALIATMFSTGARVQEILNLRACDLQLTKPFLVHLVGKKGTLLSPMAANRPAPWPPLDGTADRPQVRGASFSELSSRTAHPLRRPLHPEPVSGAG